MGARGDANMIYIILLVVLGILVAFFTRHGKDEAPRKDEKAEAEHKSGEMTP